MYDEVTEEQYKTIVSGRLQRDDFVVDDGVGGYMDNGMDEWEEEGEGRACSEDEYDTKWRGTSVTTSSEYGFNQLVPLQLRKRKPKVTRGKASRSRRPHLRPRLHLP